MEDKEILEVYELIKKYHAQYLAQRGVKLPKLMRGKNYSKNALVLVYLCRNYPNTSIVSKDELTQFVRQFHPNTNDVQQARHLGAQNGWYISSGTRKDNVSLSLSDSEYHLETLEQSYPGFTAERRECADGDDFFEELKRAYHYRCATCGSREGEPHRYWKSTTTILQKGHMDPSKPLNKDNIIPQCEKCNRPDRNYWIYDKKGRVIGIANEKVIDRCSKQMRRKIYERLKVEFEQ